MSRHKARFLTFENNRRGLVLRSIATNGRRDTLPLTDNHLDYRQLTSLACETTPFLSIISKTISLAEWIKANCVADVYVIWREDRIYFRSDRDCVLFKTFWL